MKFLLVVFPFLLIINTVAACEKTPGTNTPTIYFPAKHDSASPREDYVFQLLELLLKSSEDKYGPCTVELANFKAPLKRMQYYMMQDKEIDVIALTVSSERNRLLRPIKIPISKGLVGYRVLMIHEQTKEKFNTISSLKQLSKYVAGQGADWPDTKVLMRNRLPVTTSGNVETLVQMLSHQRFDYFPQGALQIGKVMSSYSYLSVTIADKLLLSYPSMTALYVNKENQQLAERLEYALNKVNNNGEFDRFFYNHPLSKLALNQLNIDNRNILFLCHPDLPDWAPLEDDKYWLRSWPKSITQCSK